MIKKIHIQNFKSIKKLAIEPKNLAVLIGPNSAGKSNILKALDLVIGEGWTTKGKVVRELFYDHKQPIKIQIDFTNPIEWHFFGTLKRIKFITLKMTCEPDVTCETRLWEADRQKGFYLNDDFKKLCHFIYIPSNRNLEGQMRVSSWTILGKMMRAIYENYIQQYGSEDKLKEEFKKTMKMPRDFLEKDFSKNSVTFKKFSDTFIKFCELNSAGLANSFKPELNIYNPNWFYKTLQITIREDFFINKDFDAEEVGSGMQNLILISIFQTYAELMGGRAILAIEEPEIYLYPQAQRELYKSFMELSNKSQIFYTTHNPNFVDAFRAAEIELIHKTKEEGTINLGKDKTYLGSPKFKDSKFKIYTKFNAERNELFFAKKILLVEGDSDKILWSTLCERLGVNLDKSGISIIECGGKGGVIYFIGVCKLMGIKNFFAVWDQDNTEIIEDNFDHLKQALKDGSGLEIPNNLEKFLKLPSGKGAEKVKNAFTWADKVDLLKMPSLFKKSINFLSK